MQPKHGPEKLALGLDPGVVAGFRGKIVLERQATIPKSFDVENLSPDLVPGWLPTSAKIMLTRGAAGTSSLGNEFAGLAIEANQANPGNFG